MRNHLLVLQGPDRYRTGCVCCLCAPEDYVDAEPDVHPGGLHLVGDYPSLREPPHQAPAQLLVDTCVVQNFHWARTRAPELSDTAGWQHVEKVFGKAFALELRAVFGLLRGTEEILFPSVFFPFVMSRTAWLELSRARGTRAEGLREEWRRWRSRAQDYDLDAAPWPIPHPVFSLMPEQLGWPSAGQLCLPGLNDGFQDLSPLGPFNDVGDRLLIREALRLEIYAILTTDLRTFWRHRRWLYAHGLEVWRPTDLTWAIWNDTLMYSGEGIRPAWPEGPLSAEQEEFLRVQAALAA